MTTSPLRCVEGKGILGKKEEEETEEAAACVLASVRGACESGWGNQRLGRDLRLHGDEKQLRSSAALLPG